MDTMLKVAQKMERSVYVKKNGCIGEAAQGGGQRKSGEIENKLTMMTPEKKIDPDRRRQQSDRMALWACHRGQRGRSESSSWRSAHSSRLMTAKLCTSARGEFPRLRSGARTMDGNTG